MKKRLHEGKEINGVYIKCIYPFDTDYHFCIECDLELPFIDRFCVECGCNSPLGEPCDENIDINGNEVVPMGF